MVTEDGNGSKGSKPDFLDLDKDGDKKEPMKKAAKEKKEETEYNYVNAYVEKVMGADTTMRKMAAKDRAQGKDKLLPKKEGDRNAAFMKAKIKMSPNYAGAMGEENLQRLIKSGFFTEEEVTRILWSDFEEQYVDENRQVAMNPEKYKDPDESDKPYHKRSKAARMRDPERGINSPAFKKFMADRGM